MLVLGIGESSQAGEAFEINGCVSSLAETLHQLMRCGESGLNKSIWDGGTAQCRLLFFGLSGL